MTTIALDVFLDHTCPFSYMAFRAVRQVAAAVPATVTWRPLPIAGGGASLAPAEAAMHAARQVAEWPEVEVLGAAHFGLSLRPPVWGMDAHAPAVAVHWLRRTRPEAETDFHAALFAAAFEGGRDLGDPLTLGDVARSVGAELSGLDECLASGTMHTALAADAAMAESHGATAVPAVLVGGSHLVLGAQPEAVLRMAVARVAEGMDG